MYTAVPMGISCSCRNGRRGKIQREKYEGEVEEALWIMEGLYGSVRDLVRKLCQLSQEAWYNMIQLPSTLLRKPKQFPQFDITLAAIGISWSTVHNMWLRMVEDRSIW
ncbi:hypothetical protein RYX36_035497, partial [Vicia faba]